MDVYAARTIGRIQWWLDRNASDHAGSLLDSLIADPDGVLRNPSSVARPRAGRKRFYHVRPDPSVPGLFVKVFGRPTGAWGWLRTLRSSRARREARIAQAVAARGLAVACPVAIGEERRFGLLQRSFSVIPELPARDLRSLLSQPNLSPARRRALLLGFASFTRRLHDAGIDQDDTSPNNFLVDASDCFILIDLERCKVGAALPWPRRWHLLAKLQRHGLGVTRTDRLRFLHTYLVPGAPLDVRDASRAIERSLRAVRKNDARRAAHGAFQIGRHIERIPHGWQIRGRESCPVIQFALPPAQARHVWVLAQQLERLGLPALRPVRLTPEGVEFVRPPAVDESKPCLAGQEEGKSRKDVAGSVERARRQLERYGVWKRDPEWEPTPAGPVLRDLRAFELRFDEDVSRGRPPY